MNKNLTIILAAAITGSINVNAETNDIVEQTDSSYIHNLDEVVVERQSKEHFLLRNQPLSSTIMTTAEMGSLGTRGIRELSSYVPSFVMPVYGSSYTPSVYVRGIGSRINSPSVGFYVDGMPMISKSTFSTYMFGIDRVDILRGPQGTLYGINSEGGLVRMYSRSPMNHQGTDVKLSGGSHFYRNVEATHYAKPSDKLAFSIGAFYEGQNGFFKNSYNGERADKYDQAGGRVRLMYRPNTNLLFDFITDYQYINQNANPYGVMDLETGSVAEPSFNDQNYYERNILNSGLRISYEGKGFDLTSTTSYQMLSDHMLLDNDYTEVDFVRMNQHQLQNAISQELSFKSNGSSRWQWTTGVFGSYQWLKTEAPVAFGQAFKHTIHMDMVEQTIYQEILNSMAARMGEAAAKAAIQRAGGVRIDVDMQVPGVFRTPQFNLGVFHESNLAITDNLMATLGLRYDYTHTKIDYDTNARLNILFSVLGANVNASVVSKLARTHTNNFSQLLPKFGLTYKLGKTGNIYGTVTKGYRAGGFNMQMFADILQADIMSKNVDLQSLAADIMKLRTDVELTVPHTDADYEKLYNTISFKPEESWNFELGTHLNLFGDALHLDLSTFYMLIRNQQLSVMTSLYGYGRMMVNAGKSYSCGLEASLRGKAFDNRLSYQLGYGYTHAAFKEYETGEGDSYVSYKGKRVPFVPEHTISALADYTIATNSPVLRAIVVGANVSAMGKIYWDEANTFSQKLYAVLGAHVDADFGKVKLSLWGRNITNSKYNTFAFMSRATGEPVYSAQRGNPFQMGATCNIHF